MATSDIPKRTLVFAHDVLQLCRKLDHTPGVSRSLASQLFRAGTSVGANVEEGQASQSTADFIHKYSIACKEARETLYWLRLLATTELVPLAEIEPLQAESNEIVAILTAIIKKLKAKTSQPRS